MPQADQTFTPSRRGVLAGAGAIALGAGFSLSAAAGPNLDAELLAACADYHRIKRTISLLVSPIDDEDSESLSTELCDTLRDIEEIAPRTEAGLRAKVCVTCAEFEEYLKPFKDVPLRESADCFELLALTTLQNVAASWRA